MKSNKGKERDGSSAGATKNMPPVGVTKPSPSKPSSEKCDCLSRPSDELCDFHEEEHRNQEFFKEKVSDRDSLLHRTIHAFIEKNEDYFRGADWAGKFCADLDSHLRKVGLSDGPPDSHTFKKPLSGAEKDTTGGEVR